MAVKSSGPLFFSDIVAEFGGDSDQTLSDYYRDGGRVPSTRTRLSQGVRNGFYSQWQGNVGGAGDSWYWAFAYNSSGTIVATSIRFPINSAVGITYSAVGTGTTYVRGTQTFQRGSLFQTTPANPVNEAYTEYYRMRFKEDVPYSRTITENINQSVPTEGTMFLSDFYGTTAS